MQRFNNRKKKTSWEPFANRYNKNVGIKGHYYHQSTVIPGSVKLLDLNSKSKLLDLACGQGVLARAIPKIEYYHGIDVSESLIKEAKRLSPDKLFSVADLSVQISLKERFTHASIILALQNIENTENAIKNASNHLEDNGKFLIVINHPYFRIPRFSSWDTDPNNKMQFRKIFKYSSDLKIPIDMAPGGGKKILTWSFHKALSKYSEILFKEGLFIEKIEEWYSDKESQGKKAKFENMAREEFPLFMAILCRKINIKS